MKLLFRVSAILGLIGVALGAFGAHALKGMITEDMLTIWHTATQYHLAHAVMATLCGAVGSFCEVKRFRIAGWLFVGGTIIFSGSLYLLALTGMKVLGAVTPFGGLAFMAGWLFLALAAKDLPGIRTQDAGQSLKR